jgi:hypothetical protein
MNSVLSVQVSLLTVLNLPIILSPATCCRSRGLVWFLPGTYRATWPLDHSHPCGTTASWASPLSSRLATTTGRIEFVVILRTDRSPPVALHLASRRRSYVRLQCSNPTLTGTCTPPIQHHRKRTRCGILPHSHGGRLVHFVPSLHSGNRQSSGNWRNAPEFRQPVGAIGIHNSL